MEEKVVVVYPISDSVSICALNTDEGVIQAIRTTPPGVLYV
jgi:hypothetical protein